MNTKKHPSDDANSPIEVARNISANVKNRLIACTAGRCEFRGCNKNLFQHPITSQEGNYSEAAHIVAFSEYGPRGKGERPENINNFDNLMLLCKDCHHLIDTHAKDYPISLLKIYKNEHEHRIYTLTALGPEYKTTVIQLRGTIGGQPVDIPPHDIKSALVPRFPARLPGVLIDLSGIQRENPAFFDIAREQIRRELRPAIKSELESQNVQHYSVFALAPIPVLVCLGREIGNKVTVNLFQRHRDNTWQWRENGPSAVYKFHKLKEGTDSTCVGLLLSLSGKVTLESIPSDIASRYHLYEITLQDADPGVSFLNKREDVEAFRKTYRDAIASLMAIHRDIKEVHLFPAVPAPVAIACGMDLMPKAYPDLLVYDNVKGKFQVGIKVNSEEDL